MLLCVRMLGMCVEGEELHRWTKKNMTVLVAGAVKGEEIWCADINKHTYVYYQEIMLNPRNTFYPATDWWDSRVLEAEQSTHKNILNLWEWRMAGGGKVKNIHRY